MTGVQTCALPILNIIQNVEQTAQRLGGTAELNVGEGRQDAPVGTTIAMIDQAQKVMSAVHKRLHNAQAKEFGLLRDLFKIYPESLWRSNKNPGFQKNAVLLQGALENYSIVPKADPNTASQTQRLMKVMALKQLQQSNPGAFDPIAIDMAAMKAIGWSNPEQFMVPNTGEQQMPPEMMAKAEELKIKQQDADTRRMEVEMKAQEAMMKAGAPGAPADPAQMMDMQLRQQELAANARDAQLDAYNRQRDRESRERLAAVRLAEDIAKNPQAMPIVSQILTPNMLQNLESNEPQIPSGLERPI